MGARGAYDFTDPLDETGDGTRRRVRHAHALIFGMAALSLLLALVADGGPLAQRIASGGAGLVMAVMAVLMLVWHRPPDRLLLAGFPLAALTVTCVALFDPPLALTPMYYVWPLMTATYFLQRREALWTYAFVCGSFAAIAPWAVDSAPPLIVWATVAVVGGVVVAFVGALKGRIAELVGRLHAIARVDDLTGALTRRALLERIDGEIALAREADASCALAVLDVDHFKRINDRHGHAAGDAALRRLVAVIAGRLRGADAIGRLGGEEFAVLLTGADADGAEAYAEDLRRLVAVDAAAGEVAFTVSVGVAALGTAAADGEALLAAADAALYRAKREGRDLVRVAA